MVEGNGFTFYDIYHMPIPIRRYYCKKLSDDITAKNEAAKASSSSGTSTTITMQDMINKTGAVQELKPDYISPKSKKKAG